MSSRQSKGGLDSPGRMELHNMREMDTSAYLNITSLCGPGGWQVLLT